MPSARQRGWSEDGEPWKQQGVGEREEEESSEVVVKEQPEKYENRAWLESQKLAQSGCFWLQGIE